MKKFTEMLQPDFKLLAHSLESHMSVVDIMLLGTTLGSMSDEEVQNIIDKMDKSLMPSDYSASQNRMIVRMCAMFVFL